MREPEIGEMLLCGACGGEVKPIDQKWLEWYEERKNGLYDKQEDKFLDYCGCEEVDHRL